MLRFCPKGKKQFSCVILPCVVGVATAGLIFQFMYLFPALQNQSTRYLCETSCALFYVLCFYSYYKTITIKNSVPESLILPRIKYQLEGNHPFYTEKKTCEKQNMRYKPLRTSHCHVCKCVARMDHHCPYTNGCIGASNYKVFILFCFYGGLFALEFVLMSCYFYLKLKEGKVTLGQGQLIIWMFLILFGCLLSFSMNGLWISNLIMASKNITQLDLLKGNFRFQDKNGTHPNPFDVGVFSNFNSIFNGDFWSFWWPSQLCHDNDATQFPMRPPITLNDLESLSENIRKQVKTKKAGIPETMDELYEKYETTLQGVIFFYLGKQYRLTPREVKDELRKITESVSELHQGADADDQQMSNFIQGTMLKDEDGMTPEEKQILQNLYADDADL